MMVGRLIDWFRQWFMTEAKYLEALEQRRIALEQNAIWERELGDEQTHKLVAIEALHDERLRFIDELAAKDTEIQELDRVCKERKVEKDLAERANEGLVKVNDLLHSQMEMSMGRNGAEKIRSLNEQNKNHLRDIL